MNNLITPTYEIADGIFCCAKVRPYNSSYALITISARYNSENTDENAVIKIPMKCAEALAEALMLIVEKVVDNQNNL